MNTISFVMKKPRDVKEVFASSLRGQGSFAIEYGALVRALGPNCGRAYAETPQKVGVDISFYGTSPEMATNPPSHFAVLGKVNGPNGHSIRYFKAA